MTEARKLLQLEGPFKMRTGVIQSPTLAYETWGRLNPERSNALLLFSGLSPSAHAASGPEDPSPGWWEKMLGPGCPIDTERYFVICLNSLGGCFGSTGPASIDPATGEHYRLNFPTLTIEDVANAGYQLVRRLGVSSLHTVVGASMGGLSALAFSVLHPQALRRLVSISSATRTLPFAIGLRSVQREIVREDPDWRGGRYDFSSGPINGMRTARKLGMLTYRSAVEMHKRFGRERIRAREPNDAFGREFQIESYLHEHAERFVRTFDANCYLYLSRAMDLFDLADHGGSLEAGLDRVGAKRVLVIGVETDLLFPLHQQRELADGLQETGRSVDFHALPSPQGHDSFLVDIDSFGPVIADFMA